MYRAVCSGDYKDDYKDDILHNNTSNHNTSRCIQTQSVHNAQAIFPALAVYAAALVVVPAVRCPAAAFLIKF